MLVIFDDTLLDSPPFLGPPPPRVIMTSPRAAGIAGTDEARTDLLATKLLLLPAGIATGTKASAAQSAPAPTRVAVNFIYSVVGSVARKEGGGMIRNAKLVLKGVHVCI